MNKKKIMLEISSKEPIDTKDVPKFKCFNCGRISHYAKKCSFVENKVFSKKKTLYSTEYNSSSDDSDE